MTTVSWKVNLRAGLFTITVPSWSGSRGAMPSAGMPSVNLGPPTSITFSMHWSSLASDAEQAFRKAAGKEILLLVGTVYLCLELYSGYRLLGGYILCLRLGRQLAV